MSRQATEYEMLTPSNPTHVDTSPQLAAHDTNERGLKRRRTQLACTACRQRKIRCDGTRPQCSPCVVGSLPCDYELIAPDDISRKRYKSRAELVQQVKELEGRLRRIPHTSTTQPMHEAVDDMNQPSSTASPTAPIDEPLASAESEEDAGVDVLATAAFEQDADLDTPKEYFGPSSNHALFQCVLSAFTRLVSSGVSQSSLSRTRRLRLPRNSGTEKLSQWSGQSAKLADNELISWPSQTDARQLIDHFFASVGIVLPVVSKQTLFAHWSKCQSPKPSQSVRTSRALLYMVFAHAAAAYGRQNARQYYRMALASLDEYRLRSTSIELVQVLILVCTFQQNNQISISSWTYHALAVKAAFQLGLHSPAIFKECGLQESELRKRLWYALINQDRILCTSLGRPLLIPKQYIHTEKTSDPRSVSRNGPVVDPRYLDGLQFFNHLISLNEIVASMLQRLFKDNIVFDEVVSKEILLGQRLPLYLELEKWRHELPLVFKVLSSIEMQCLPTPSAQVDRFRLILTVHYYRAILYANAPLLTMLLEETSGSSNGTDTYDNPEYVIQQLTPILKANFDASKSLCQAIKLFDKQSDSFIDQNNAWWLCNFTILTAGLHLFGTLLICHDNERFLGALHSPLVDVRLHVSESLEIMKAVQRTSVMALKARRCLAGFLEVFDSLVSVQQPTPASLTELQRADRESFVSVPFELGCTGDYSQYITQAATDFLSQFGQHDFLDQEATFLENYTF